MTKLILVDPVEEDVEEIRPRTDPPNVLQCDLKKRTNIIHSSWSSWSIITFYIGYGNRITFFIQIFQCDHRLTSFCQLDLQEAGKSTLKFQVILECQENIFRKF